MLRNTTPSTIHGHLRYGTRINHFFQTDKCLSSDDETGPYRLAGVQIFWDLDTYAAPELRYGARTFIVHGKSTFQDYEHSGGLTWFELKLQGVARRGRWKDIPQYSFQVDLVRSEEEVESLQDITQLLFSVEGNPAQWCCAVTDKDGSTRPVNWRGLWSIVAKPYTKDAEKFDFLLLRDKELDLIRRLRCTLPF